MGTSDQTERLKKLSPAKRALLIQALQKEAAREQQPEAIPRRAGNDHPPLSFAQQRMWLIDRLEAGSVAYNVPFAVRMKGRLDVAVFEQSVNEIVARHEVLRTTFRLEGDRPAQFVAPSLALSVPVLSLEETPAAEREEQTLRLAAEEARRPFDLARGPLLRVTLLRLGEEEHVALITMHHIVSDGWSDAIFIREMVALYEAARAGRPSPLEELPIQYADFAIWQRERLQGERLNALLDFWKQRLAGAPPLLELPTDRPRPAVPTHGGAVESYVLPEPVYESLKALSREAGVTLFVTLLAGFKALLGRYTGQSDIVVGTPVANRTTLETEGLIGFFLNTLALRTDLSGDPTFRQLLERAQATTLEAQAHQDLPFELLVESLGLERDLSYAPLFQVLFVYQNRPVERLERAELSLAPIEVHSGTSKFDLNFVVVEGVDGRLAVNLEYNTDLFEAATIRRLLAHFETLLGAAGSGPDRRLSELPLLARDEEQRILVAWNDTAAVYPDERGVHRPFEARAAETPDAVAVVYEDESLTYGELNERANRLAHRLRSVGVGAESVVGVLMERSVEMVVSLFATLKAGAAYLPLDPSYPQPRLAFMLEDAQTKVLLTQKRLRDSVSVPEGVVLLVVDEEEGELSRFAPENPAVEIDADNIAYVIYTSGSTGTPKGVMVTHRAISNRLLWMQQEYGLDASDVVLQKTPFGFDVSVWEFFWPLREGARLVVARPGGHQDVAYLTQLIKSQGVTTLHFVPSMMELFLEGEGLEECRSVRRVMSSGEALVAGLVQKYYERMPGALHNLYGPTEAAVDVTFWECARDGDASGRGVPIGRPITNIQMYVLDANMKPVPAGVAGELYIGGVGLARGYMGRPSLTAERFVPRPFATEPGARLYRTGDVGRHREDGAIEYTGRADFQVKIRGNRVELGEIETVLRGHEAVRDAVVMARTNHAGEQQLVAYVVTEKDVADDELRRYVWERLPQYMVPAVFVKLDELPLSPNGKVDRRALPEVEKVEGGRPFAAPSNEIEEALAAVWAQVFRTEAVSVDDNFFALGGDSIRIVQVVSQAQRRGLNFEAQLIYQHQTIRELARELEASVAAAEAYAPELGEEEELESLAELMQMLEGLSEDDVRTKVKEKTRTAGGN